MKQKLVLFDFDGTITTKDTFLEFIRFYHGTPRFIAGFAAISPFLILLKLKLIHNWRAKEKALGWFFKNEDIKTFNEQCALFCSKEVPKLIRPKALAEIKKYKDEGAEITVVSASAENWVKPWCDTMGLNCLATQLEVIDGKITGKICGINCHGVEKEKRIREKYSLDQFIEVLAYGDSSGDREMLALAHQKFYKPFRD